jgi:hypothetical protein
MALFDDRTRTRTDPMRDGESLFKFYDSCAVSTFAKYRELLNEWLRQLSPADAAKMISNMRKGSNAQFQSALCELMVHRLLRQLEYRVDIHPKLEHTTRQPDFLARDARGAALCYVEVTTTNLADAETSQANREAQLYNAINEKTRLPEGLILGYSLEKSTRNMPKSGWFAAEIGKWARGETQAAQREDDPLAYFEKDGWRVEVTLHRCSYVPRGAIGISSGDARWIAPEIELREALEGKGTKYGDLGTPYLVVVADARGEIVSTGAVGETLTNALLGYEVDPERLDLAGKGTSPLARESGFWFRKARPDNIEVSAVLLLPDAEITKLRRQNRDGMLAFNPWAKYPLSEAFLPLSRLASRSNRWTNIPGARTADILGIPEGWPPERVWA